MRLLFIVLLAAVTLLASVDAASPDFSPATRSITGASPNDIGANRFLRAEKRVEDGDANKSDEERTLPVAAVETMGVYNTRLATKAFQLLELDKRKGLLFGTPALRTWANLMLKLDKKNPKGSMIEIMTKYYGETALARYIQYAKGSVSMGKLATELQAAQFAKWAKAGETTTSISKMLKRVPATHKLEIQRDNGLEAAYTLFLKPNPAV